MKWIEYLTRKNKNMNEAKQVNNVISSNNVVQSGYCVEIRDNLPNTKPIVINGLILIGKEWVKLNPDWLEGKPPNFNVQIEDSSFTDFERNGLLPYAAAMALGWAFLGMFRLRQVEFRIVKCELKTSATVTKEQEFEPIRLPNYGMV